MNEYRYTEVLNSLQRFDDTPATYDVWSNPVTQVWPCEPSMFMGMNDASMGSKEPNSTASMIAVKTRCD